MIAQFRTFGQQRVALRRLMDKTTNEIMYGGGARGGKSYLGCGWVLMMALAMPGSKWLVGREEATKLRDTTLLSFFQVSTTLKAKSEYTYKADGGAGTAFFQNGSIIFFRELKYIPSDPMFDRLGSYDLTGAFIDEAQQIHPQAINVLRGRFSTLSGEGWKTVPKMLFTCNPSKNWIYTDFYKPSKEGTLPQHRAFVISLATDNPFIDEAYIENLRRSDKITVERLLYGNFEYDDDPSVLMGYDAISDIFTAEGVPPGKKYITVDVARFGSDKSRIGIWDGWRLVRRVELAKKSTSEVAAEVRKLATEYRVPMSQVVIDDDGVGGGVRDQLPGAKGFINNARPLPNPNAKTPDERKKSENFEHLKAQCYYGMAGIINAGGLWVVDATPTEQELIREELAQVKRKDMDKDGPLKIVPKDDVKKALGRSPDFSDMMMMRYYFELQPAGGGYAW